MSDGSLRNKHLAELHALADERGIERYRMLTRAELLEELGAGSGDDESAGGDGGNGTARGGRRGGRGGGREAAEEEEREKDPVTGILDITSRGHGFIRRDGEDEESEADDVYVSPSQIRRCELQRGDEVSGPVRKARRGERHAALVHVDTVNGAEPGAERSGFEELEAVPPSRRLPLSGEGLEPNETALLRAVDLLAPLARGQRVLVNAGRGSGRTTLLRALAGELSKADDLSVVVVLIDERPEEEAAWRKLEGVELAIATADLRPGEQLRLAELAVARAKRRAEAGEDVALLFDSLSRLAVAADDPGATKPIFAAGRETAEESAGSLTVVATALTDDDDGGVSAALSTTENATITLSAELAEAGVHPALEIGGCRTVGEAELRPEAELAGARALRAELAGLPATDAVRRLLEKLDSAPTNDSLLASLA